MIQLELLFIDGLGLGLGLGLGSDVKESVIK